MNKQTVKWAKQISREQFKDRKLGTRIFGLKKMKYQEVDSDFDEDYDIDSEEFFFWQQPRKLSK